MLDVHQQSRPVIYPQAMPVEPEPTVEHHPSRADWHCHLCRQAWPCVGVRAELARLRAHDMGAADRYVEHRFLALCYDHPEVTAGELLRRITPLRG